MAYNIFSTFLENFNVNQISYNYSSYYTYKLTNTRSVGEYVAILVLLIKRDVPQFVTVFLVIIFSLGGALYFALTGHYNQNNMDTENNNDTR